MTLRAVFRRAATAEFTDAAAWYEDRRSGLGEEFIHEVETAIERAAAAPASYQIASRDVRRAVLRRFPYCIYFRVRQDMFVVLAVFHGRRDPQVWQRRT